jgi:hypothetical protein
MRDALREIGSGQVGISSLVEKFWGASRDPLSLTLSAFVWRAFVVTKTFADGAPGILGCSSTDVANNPDATGHAPRIHS